MSGNDRTETTTVSEPWTGTNHPEVDALIGRALGGDEAAFAELFERFRPRLRRMIETRLDRRLRGRVDVSDVLQDAYLRLSDRLESYRALTPLPFFVWLRFVAGECLQGVHRHHLGAARRDAAVEVSLYQGPMPLTDSFSLAAQLIGKQTTASQKLMRAEAQIQLQEAINALEPIDREILVLRHFEGLSNAETSQTLGITESAASSRFYRALRRLKEMLDPYAPGDG